MSFKTRPKKKQWKDKPQEEKNKTLDKLQKGNKEWRENVTRACFKTSI
jgi:hypothetical protein